MSAEFDTVKNNRSVFYDSQRNDVVMFGRDSSQQILIGTQKVDASGNPLQSPASISIVSSSNLSKTEFRIPVEIDHSLNVQGDVSITDGGSLGIGTSNPTARLHVVGDVFAEGGGLYIFYRGQQYQNVGDNP